MALENKLGLTSSADLAREEERISKKSDRALYVLLGEGKKLVTDACVVYAKWDYERLLE